MSFFPSPVLVRLQELKLWQGNYDSLLQNKSKDGTTPSDYETIEGLSALDSSRSSPLSSPDREKGIDWDKKAISPSKPFEQLLEEKLALDRPVQVQAKPKRPFLKKGSGLTRYKLNPQPPLPRRIHGKPFRSDEKIRSKRYSNELAPSKSTLISPRSLNQQRQQEPEIDLTPLKMPDFAIKPKATWCKVLEGDNANQQEKVDNQSGQFAEQIYKSCFNSPILGKINDLNLRRILPLSPRKGIFNKNYSESICTIPEVELERSPSLCDEPIYDKTTESELRIFEALEEKVEHSSFSSTNSSIIRLLSSTPTKVKNKLLPKSSISDERKIEREGIPSGYHVQGIQNTLLQKKLREVNKRTDVLHDFLKNLRKIGDNSDKMSSGSSGESVRDKFPDTSFSDEEKWSSQTDTDRSRSPSTFFTDNDNTYKDNTTTRIDVAVNTSFEDLEEQSKKCQNCDELQVKFERVSKQLPDIQAEKARVCDFAKELEVKRDQLNKDMQKMKEKHEKVISELKEELENEKRRFAREKTVFDMYIKDSHNRPTKKEREEIFDLKKEIVDVKELLKLKESKSGATQARLRNQIKQLEKENTELKIEVEKLQKENAKLNATQLMRRPSEVKMLHEINRNLTKLTEETMKKQANKTNMSCNTENTIEFNKKSSRKLKEANVEKCEQEMSSPRVKNKNSCPKHRISENESMASNINETSRDMTTFASLSLEKQYENVFGQFSISGLNNNSLNDSKKERTERIFEDGSKEINYSNGNIKTISPDGNLVVVKYYNGDIKETNILENTLKYFYAENEAWHIQYSDGTEVLEYPNGQKEKTFKDGRKEVACPDGSFLVKNPDGTEEISYPDGSRVIKNLEGEKVLFLPNGQKEIHTKEHKRREYPDGTVKILYPDGTQETRYASGRIRIKDSNGVLIVDSHNPVL